MKFGSLRLLNLVSPLRLVNTISNLGCDRTMNRKVQNLSRVVNRLAAITSLAGISVSIFMYWINSPLLETMIILSIGPLMTIPIIFNARGLFHQAKQAHLIIAHIIILGVSFCFGHHSHFQFFFLILAGLPFIFFPNSHSSLKWAFTLLAVVNWIIVELFFGFSEPFLSITVFEQTIFRFINNSLQFMFIIVMFYFFAIESESHLKKIEREQSKLEASNKQLDVALERAKEATMAKSMFLANMSHEIRTPLNGIIVASDLVNNGKLSSQQREMMGIVKNSGRSLLSIVNNILDLSKSEANKLELETAPFDLHKLIESTVHSFTFQLKEKDLEIQTQLDPTISSTYLGDEQKLRQILTNLLGNAVKFCEAGRINIIVDDLKTSTDGFQTMRFRIEDSGIGISSDKIGHIFESFTQEDGSISRAYGGTGLGTTISKMLVELMDGTIEAKSPNPNNTFTDTPGSVFSFTVSLKKIAATSPSKKPSTSEPKEPAEHVDFGNAKMLLAEDNVINQQVALQLFSTLGCDLEIASDGIEALEKVAKNDYELIFMDQMMPNMDGISATKKLRERGVKTIIIAMSANVLDEDRKACIDAGMNDYISKPVLREELIEKIRYWMNGNPAQCSSFFEFKSIPKA